MMMSRNLLLSALALGLATWGCSDGGSVGRDLGTDLRRPDMYKYKQDTGYVPPPKDVGVTDMRPFKDGAPPTPDKGPPDGGGSTVITAPFTLGFELGNGGLKGTRDWQWGKLAFKKGKNCDTTPVPPKSGKSGNHVWGTVLNDCHSPLNNGGSAECANTSLGDDSVLSFKVKLPNWVDGKGSLVYYQWTDIFYPHDWHFVRIIDGGKSLVYKSKCSGESYSAPLSWEQRTILLDSYLGKTITIEFHFIASGVVNYAGWYLDDIAVLNQ